MEPEATPDSLPPEPKWSSSAASVFVWAQQHLTPAGVADQRSAETLAKQQRLEQELAAARAELAAIHELLEDIPQIFERKYQERLLPIREKNASLRRQLQQLQGTQTPRIRGALRHAFGLPPSRS